MVVVKVSSKGKPKVEVLVPATPEESLQKVAGLKYVRKLKEVRAQAKQVGVAEGRKKYKAKA